MKKIKVIGLLLAVMFAVLVFGTTEAFVKNDDGIITVEKGDNPSKISYKLYGTSRFYSEIMKAAEITNPKRLPIGKRFATPRVGVIAIRNFNTAPYGAGNNTADPKIIMAIKATDYSDEIKECLIKGVSELPGLLYLIEPGMWINCYSDKKGIYCPRDGYEFTFKTDGHMWPPIICDGKKYHIGSVDKCGNFFSYDTPLPPPKVEIPETPIVTKKLEPGLPPAETKEPPIEVIEIPETPEITAPPTEEEKFAKWEGRVEAFLGTGKVWDSHSHAKWNYADITLYPFSWETEEGRDYLGFGGIYNRWYGKVPDGRFSGKKELLKPLKYKSFDYEDNWDYSVEGLFGQYRNKFSSFDGKIKNREKYHLYGGGLNYNNYARQEAGEQWFPETQIWTFLLGTANRFAETTFEGKPVENTDKRINMILDAGVRQFIYNFEDIPLRTYLQAEFFGEIPRSKFLNLGAGLSDKWKILFAEVGTQIDLKKGKFFKLADIGVDASEAGRVAIRAYRRSKVVSGLEKQYGIKIDRDDNGAIIVNDSKNREVIEKKETNEKAEVNYNNPSGISPIKSEYY